MATQTRHKHKKNTVPANLPAGNGLPDETREPLETGRHDPSQPGSEAPHTPADNCPPPTESENGNTAIIIPDDQPAEETAHHTSPPPQPAATAETALPELLPADGETPAGNPLLSHRELLEQHPDAPFYTTLRQALDPGSTAPGRSQALERLDTLARIARLIARITPRNTETPGPETESPAGRPYLSREYLRMQQQHPLPQPAGRPHKPDRPYVSPQNL